MASVHKLTTVQMKQAIQIREQIELLQEKLAALLGGTAPKAKPGRPAAKRKKVVAGRGRMGDAPKGRWAHVRSPLDTLMEAAPRQTSGLTAMGRAKLSAVMKARWATREKGVPAPNASTK